VNHGGKCHGHDVRQSPETDTARSLVSAVSVCQSPAVSPTLLTDEQAAQWMNISRRTFRQLQSQHWMPKPIVLGPRLVRWSRLELEQAVGAMPRQRDLSEPAQLRRSRIDSMKRRSSQ
jgi:predicted DNA-binding transcriptional regulator AlpA